MIPAQSNWECKTIEWSVLLRSSGMILDTSAPRCARVASQRGEMLAMDAMDACLHFDVGKFGVAVLFSLLIEHQR